MADRAWVAMWVYENCACITRTFASRSSWLWEFKGRLCNQSRATLGHRRISITDSEASSSVTDAQTSWIPTFTHQQRFAQAAVRNGRDSGVGCYTYTCTASTTLQVVRFERYSMSRMVKSRRSALLAQTTQPRSGAYSFSVLQYAFFS